MDPYKVLGLSAKQVKGSSAVDAARHRAKKLFKRYVAEKKKFDAKKVLEAFEMVKANAKNKPGEGVYKILGRSRKERELDKHFNHQTKEIKKNKDLKQVLQCARKGEKRFHLPGDKERIPRHRRQKRRRAGSSRGKHIDALQGLQRLSNFLSHREKFPKVLKLLQRWMQEYMNAENRDFVFAVLQGITQTDFLMEELEAHQDVVQIFEYVMGYFSAWFESAEEHRVLGCSWQVATVLPCRCLTDDSFVLSATLSKLNDMLALLERCRESCGEDGPGLEAEGNGKAEQEQAEGPGRSGRLKAEGESVGRLRAKPEPEGSKGEAKEEPEAQLMGRPKLEAKDEAKLEAKTEFADGQGVLGLGLALPVATLPGDGGPAEQAAKQEQTAGLSFSLGLSLGLRVAKSPLSEEGELQQSQEAEEVESLGSSEDVESLGSTDDEAQAPIDLGSESDDEEVKEEEISSDESLLLMEGASDSESDGVEVAECPAFAVPSAVQSLRRLRAHLVYRCLAALFQQRGPRWATPKIDAFFQDVFHRRSIFAPEQQVQVEAWQARIKDLQKLGERSVGEANNPLEAHRPVKDSREERVALDADSNVWAAKQTFDSRDRAGARQVIR